MSRSTLLLAIITLVLAVTTWGLHASRMRDEGSLERGPGVVERFMTECRDGQSRGIFRRCPTYPVVRFETADGMPHHFISNVGRGFTKLHERQSVVVLYDRRDPLGTARILDYGIPPEWLVGGVAAGSLLVSLTSLLHDRRRPKWKRR